MITEAQHLIVLALADWRLASLFANESGPFDLFKHVRRLAGVIETPEGQDDIAKNKFAEGLLCEWCNSVWFGTLIVGAYLLAPLVVVYVLLPLALSTVVIIIKYAVEALQAFCDYQAERKEQVTQIKQYKINGAVHYFIKCSEPIEIPEFYQREFHLQ